MGFTVPKRCTIGTVNKALKAAGLEKMSIIEDAYNNYWISECYEHWNQGGPYVQFRKTWHKTPREWAEAFVERLDEGFEYVYEAEYADEQ